MLFISTFAFSNVVSSFSCNATRGCSPLVVNTTNHSTGGVTSWHWDLGNGNISTQTNPSATYTIPGNYTIKLIVSNGIVSDSISQVITVYGKPVVDFISDKVTACPGDSINFISLLNTNNGPITQYAWGFGNGAGSADQNSHYKYSLPGSYNVTLVISDTNGCSANITKPNYMQIWSNPVAAYTVTPAISCGASQQVTFTDQSQGTGLSYSLSFGDSTSASTSGATHSYTYGKYRSAMLVTNNHGCTSIAQNNISVVNLHASFSVDKLVACAGEELSFTNQSPMVGTQWSWNFGDGGTSAKQSPKHIYANPGIYSVTFVIKDGTCKDSITRVALIRITSGFALSFTPDHTNSCTAPFTVHFTSHASTTVTYAWDFGNGQADSSADPIATYNIASTYNVSLTAIDSNGCKVTVASPGLIHTSKPITKFVADTVACPGAVVRLTNQTTLTPVRYHWQFGDGDTSNINNPQHRYRNIGNYTVSLRVTDSIGCDSTVTKHNYVHINPAQVDFTVGQTFSLCPPLVTNFRSIVNRPDLRLRWDFGDGYTDTAANPTHIFFHPGVYTVKLMGTANAGGCTDTIIYPNLITVQGPTGQFSVTSNNGCVPLVVNFIGSASSNTQQVTCDLGNGVLTHNSLNFNYTYTAARTYHPKFILTDHIGCSIPYDLDSIVARSSPSLHLQDTSICEGHSVAMDLGPDHYSWIGTPCDTCGRIPNITDTTAMATLAPTVTTNYSVTATNSSGCSVTGNFRVNVGFMTTLTPKDTVTICQNETIRLRAAAGDTMVWIPSTFLNNASIASPTCTPSSSVTYRVFTHGRVGCGTVQAVPVNVRHLNVLPPSAPVTLCQNETVSLTASRGDTVSWSPATFLNNPSISSPQCTPASSVTYTVTTHNKVGCSTTQDVPVNVNHMKLLPARAPITLCQNETIDLGVVAGDTVIWTPTTYLNNPSSGSPLCTPTSSVRYIVIANNRVGCSTYQEVPVNVLNRVRVSVTPDTTICPGASARMAVTVIDSSALGVNYSWSPASYLDNSRASEVVARMNTQSETFRVITTSGGCIPDTSTISVNVRPAATVKLPSTITTVIDDQVELTMVSGDLTTYQWSAAEPLSCNDCKSTTIVPTETQFVRITGANEYGCTADDSVLIHVLKCDPEAVFVPNTFTPNGDGLHDMLYMHSRTLTHLETFRVYDRWGAMVFETGNITEGWDGMINGKLAAQGVYLFTIKGKCNSGYDVEKNGTITLIR
jgi:gliding motility-associated-like protein